MELVFHQIWGWVEIFWISDSRKEQQQRRRGDTFFLSQFFAQMKERKGNLAREREREEKETPPRPRPRIKEIGTPTTLKATEPRLQRTL